MKEFAYIHEEGRLPTLLNNIPFLESFTDGHRNDILYSSYFIQCDVGDILIEQGADDSRIFILLTGEAEVIKDNEPITVINKSGEIFGELAIVSDEKRSATVRAKTELLCLVIDQKFLSEIKPEGQNASYYAAFYGFLCKVMADRLKRNTQHLAKVEKELEELRTELHKRV
ncbi:MAG: cyclic nucleotide-binding domain-containing protein [Verrucomicrobia bacterium]|nr:cyclic nucleotide-binding domain-containing protein [Verrucomicrobiota bacterium]